MANVKKSKSTLVTTSKRELLKNRLDDFATFTWRDVDMFDNFGAFIVNAKNNLKFYNGGGFSNDYSKPAFQSNMGNLMGVSFNMQTIEFTIGVYWFSEEEYREFIYFLNPYVIDNLTFSFDSDYRYLVKLASVPTTSTRYFLGYEPVTTTNEDDETETIQEKRWYTELQLKFDVQGEAVARGQLPYTWKKPWEGYAKKILTASSISELESTTNVGTTYKAWKLQVNTSTDFIGQSNLDTPVIFSSTLALKKETTYEIYPGQLFLELKLIAGYGDNNSGFIENELFTLVLKNLEWVSNGATLLNSNDTINRDATSNIHIEYDSESGLLFWTTGGTKKLLTLLSSNSYGDNIVDSMQVKKFKINGTYNVSTLDYSKMALYFIVSLKKDTTNISLSDISVKGVQDDDKGISIECYPRTTLI